MCFFPRSSFSIWGRVAILGESYYRQLDMFAMMNIEGDGDKLFGVVRTKKDLLI